jgi:hypothetical protein
LEFEKTSGADASELGFLTLLSPARIAQTIRYFQTVPSHQVRVCQYDVGRAIGNEFSTIEYQHSRANIEYQFEIVGCYQFCAWQSVKQANEIASPSRIEERGRFIQQQHRWLHGQHTRQSGSPLVATRELEGNSITGSRRQTNGRESIESPRLGIIWSSPRVEGPKTDVIENCRAEQLIVRILKNNTNDSWEFLTVRGVGWIEPAYCRLPCFSQQYSAKTEE